MWCLLALISVKLSARLWRIFWTLVFGDETCSRHAIHAPRECAARQPNFHFQLPETEGSLRRALQLQEHVVCLPLRAPANRRRRVVKLMWESPWMKAVWITPSDSAAASRSRAC